MPGKGKNGGQGWSWQYRAVLVDACLSGINLALFRALFMAPSLAPIAGESPGQEIRPVGQRPPGLFVDFRPFDEVVDLGELMLGRWRRAFVTGFSRESYACSLKCLALFCVQI